jgi:hypothetical protein
LILITASPSIFLYYLRRRRKWLFGSFWKIKIKQKKYELKNLVFFCVYLWSSARKNHETPKKNQSPTFSFGAVFTPHEFWDYLVLWFTSRSASLSTSTVHFWFRFALSNSAFVNFFCGSTAFAVLVLVSLHSFSQIASF